MRFAKGDIPTVPGVNTLQGTATVNDNTAKVGTPVKPGDRVARRAKRARQ
jgi:hypothetical protein